MFPQHELHETLGVVYFHYWLFEGCDESFNTHLNVLKDFFCRPKNKTVVECVVHGVLYASTLEVEKSMFKTTMKSNAKVALVPFNTINPFTKIWNIIFKFAILFCNI
jgi:hypothetical protein